MMHSESGDDDELVKDETTVTGTCHRQVGKVLQEVHSKDEVRHGRQSGCRLSKRNVKVDKYLQVLILKLLYVGEGELDILNLLPLTWHWVGPF